MKLILAQLIVFLGFSFANFPAVADPSSSIDPAKYSAPIRVACIGDSITQGYGAEKDKSYPSQLQALLGDKWQVQNFGVGGRTILKKGNLPYWTMPAFKKAQDFKPDVVIIMLGTNDTKRPNWVHHDEFYADYKEMVETFKGLDSKPRIFICKPCPVMAPGNWGINEENIQLEIPLIDQLATEENVSVIDMHTALLNQPTLFKDRVHPNTIGAGILAQTAAQALLGK